MDQERPGYFSIVSKEASKQRPYPYVHVEEDGSVRELTDKERKHLETEFSGADGARPAIKRSYYSVFPSGHRGGYCARELIPEDLSQPAPQILVDRRALKRRDLPLTMGLVVLLILIVITALLGRLG